MTSYTYDTLGRITQKVVPKGNAARSIDANGNPTGSADANFATSFAWYGISQWIAPPAACGGSSVNQAGLLRSKQAAGMALQTFYV